MLSTGNRGEVEAGRRGFCRFSRVHKRRLDRGCHGPHAQMACERAAPGTAFAPMIERTLGKCRALGSSPRVTGDGW